MSPHLPTIAFIGGGNMAYSLIGAIQRGASPAAIAVAEPDPARRALLAHDFGVAAHAAAAAAVAAAEVIVLAVKPQVLPAACAQVRAALGERRPLIVSIAAGARLDQIDDWLGGGFPIVRAMPNTPAMIGAGATGLIANAAAGGEQRDRAEALLAAAGRTAWIAQETLMDAVTAVSGSGPAYFFLLVEALEDAAVSQGLPRDTARALAVQTCLGAGRMLAEGDAAPATQRERVTSPGGTTQAALDAFAAGDFRGLVARAVDAAVRRGRELSSPTS